MILRVIRRKAGPALTLSLWTRAQRELSTAEVAQLTPEAIINDQVRKECVKRLKLINVTKRPKDNTNKAAVLVPLCIHNGKLGLLYTLRSNKVSTNRGQVSFPGGMKDKTDLTLEDTALRETWEELRIPKDSIDVWGSANLIERKHVTVLPVLGFIGEVDPKKLHVNTHEVEEAFVQPLEMLCEPAHCRFTQFKDNYTLPTYLGGDHKIWGLTAVITHVVLSALIPDVYKHKLVYLKSIDQVKQNSSTSTSSEARKS